MPKFDLIIKDGHMIDPGRNINKKIDIGIKGNKIVKNGKINKSDAEKCIDADGCIVTPGLIDLHAHVYYGDLVGIDPDVAGPKTGVTTIVDAGSAGAMNYKGFYEHIVKKSKTRVLSFINISYAGMRLTYTPEIYGVPVFGELEDMRLILPEITAKIAERDEVVGVKVRPYAICAITNRSNTIYAVKAAKYAARAAGVPLMCHLGDGPPWPEDYVPLLNKGDILTHIYGTNVNIFNKNGEIREVVLKARKRGVKMSGGQSPGQCFSYEIAKKAISKGFLPDLITSDMGGLSIGFYPNYKVESLVDNPPSIEPGGYSLPVYLSIFHELGLSLEEVIRRVTYDAAHFLNRPSLGTLEEGSIADITILKKEEGKFEYNWYEGDGTFTINVNIDPQVTIKDGRILMSKLAV